VWQAYDKMMDGTTRPRGPSASIPLRIPMQPRLV